MIVNMFDYIIILVTYGIFFWVGGLLVTKNLHARGFHNYFAYRNQVRHNAFLYVRFSLALMFYR